MVRKVPIKTSATVQATVFESKYIQEIWLSEKLQLLCDGGDADFCVVEKGDAGADCKFWKSEDFDRNVHPQFVPAIKEEIQEYFMMHKKQPNTLIVVFVMYYTNDDEKLSFHNVQIKH